MGLAIIRSTAAVILSLFIALVLVVAVEGFSAIVHPFPPEFAGSYEEMVAHVANYPGWVLAICALMYGATTFISAWLATRLGATRHPAHGYGVGAFLILAVIYNMSQLPYPLWFEVLVLLLFPLGIYWGVKLGRGETDHA